MLLNPYRFASAPATDPYFANVVLLTHFETSESTTVPVDRSPVTKAFGVGGIPNATISTAQSKFGASSALLTAANSSYFQSPSVAAFYTGTSPFTIECWIRPSAAVLAGGFNYICGQQDTSGGYATNLLAISSGKPTIALWVPSLAGFAQVTGPSVLTAGQWYHIAGARRTDGAVQLFIDGVSAGTFAVNPAFAMMNSTSTIFGIGRGGDYGGGGYFDGYIDELRFTVGVNRYASGNFTPPTAAFPNS